MSFSINSAIVITSIILTTFLTLNEALVLKQYDEVIKTWEWNIIRQNDKCFHSKSAGGGTNVYVMYLDNCDVDSSSIVKVRFLSNNVSDTILNNFYKENIFDSSDSNVIESAYIQAFSEETRNLGCISVDHSRPFSRLVIGNCAIRRPIRTFSLRPTTEVDSKGNRGYQIQSAVNFIEEPTEKVPSAGSTRGFSETLCWQKPRASNEKQYVEQLQCSIDKTNEIKGNNSLVHENVYEDQIFYFKKLELAEYHSISKFLTKAQQKPRYPGSHTQSSHLINGINENCVSLDLKDKDDLDNPKKIMYSGLRSGSCESEFVLDIKYNQEQKTLETTIHGKKRCVGVDSEKLTEKVKLMDCPSDNNNSESDILKTKWNWHGVNLGNQQLQNEYSKLCMDLEHNHRKGRFLQWTCKPSTGYKPANQLFIFAEEDYNQN